VIHYSEFVARRASTVPLLGAIASLAAIAICLGDPQAGIGAAAAAGVPAPKEAVLAAPEAWNEERTYRVRNPSELIVATLQNDPAGFPHAAVLLFNRDRAIAGLPPLVESATLGGIASMRAHQMVIDGLTHVRPGTTVFAASELLKQSGLVYTWHGENIYWSGGPPFDDAISSAEGWWMTSPEHRDNILSRHFRQVGVGTAVDGGKIYISAVFTD
jgi:uncharacterized protein YkwD